MAEGYLYKRFKEMGLDDILVISSGTAATYGRKPTAETIEVMKEEGIDVSGYISSGLSKLQVENADAILVMEPKHADAILGIVPDAAKKTHLLKEFAPDEARADGNNSIEDPIGMPLEFYRKTVGIIKKSIEGFLKWIKK